MLSSASLMAINLYQRHLSPRKGYACAYRIEHNDTTGCSGFAKQRIQEVGLWRAIPDVRARFASCREAAEARRRRREERRANGDTACVAAESCETCSECGKVGGGVGSLSRKCDGCDSCDAPDCGSCS